jgi:hypothetical protein
LIQSPTDFLCRTKNRSASFCEKQIIQCRRKTRIADLIIETDVRGLYGKRKDGLWRGGGRYPLKKNRTTERNAVVRLFFEMIQPAGQPSDPSGSPAGRDMVGGSQVFVRELEHELTAFQEVFGCGLWCRSEDGIKHFLVLFHFFS